MGGRNCRQERETRFGAQQLSTKLLSILPMSRGSLGNVGYVCAYSFCWSLYFPYVRSCWDENRVGKGSLLRLYHDCFVQYTDMNARWIDVMICKLNTFYQ